MTPFGILAVGVSGLHMAWQAGRVNEDQWRVCRIMIPFVSLRSGKFVLLGSQEQGTANIASGSFAGCFLVTAVSGNARVLRCEAHDKHSQHSIKSNSNTNGSTPAAAVETATKTQIQSTSAPTTPCSSKQTKLGQGLEICAAWLEGLP